MDIDVVLDTDHAEHLDDTVARLKAAGLHIISIDADNGVVEGSIEGGQLAAIKRLDGVRHIRNIFTYIADYPPGDPRDRDSAPGTT